MIVIAPQQPPPAAPPACASPRHLRVYREDDLLVRAANGYAEGAVPVWPLIHQVVDQQVPRTRSERRRLTAAALCRMRVLLRCEVLVRDGNGHVRLNEMLEREPAKPPREVKNLPPSVIVAVPGCAGYCGGGSSGKVFMA